jgi:hypothetical protein
MIHLLLASYLATQQWGWDRSTDPDVTAYRIYFSNLATCWTVTDRVEVSSVSCGNPPCEAASQCCGEVPEPSWPMTFFVVTAVDSSGNEGPTDHGLIKAVCP